MIVKYFKESVLTSLVKQSVDELVCGSERRREVLEDVDEPDEAVMWQVSRRDKQVDAGNGF